MLSEADQIAANGEPTTAPGHSAARSLALYLLPMILGPLLIPLAAVLIVPSNWFARHSGLTYLMTVGYGATLRDVNCEVVIYGDSTGMIGINPGIISKRTGLSTCNIAEYMGVTMLEGTRPVDEYLAHNRPPRVMIFSYAPEDLNPREQYGSDNIMLFEAITYRLRQPGGWLNVLFRHPAEFFDWSCRGLRLAAERATAKPFAQEIEHLRDKTGGQVVLDDARVLGDCSYTARISAPDMKWIGYLRSNYSRRGTRVLVDAMPLPVCDPGLGFYRSELPPVIDNDVATFPLSAYLPGGRHTTAAGSVLLSERIAAQVLSMAPGIR